jgi:peptidyl-prolyl cis-trans isomerase D
MSETDADTVIKELNAGADFTSLAKLKSKDPQVNTNGGSLGWIENDKTRVPVEILNVIFNPSTRINTPLKIKVENQWYVMIVNSYQTEVIKTYTELADKAMFDTKDEKRVKALEVFLKVLEGKFGKPIPQK